MAVPSEGIDLDAARHAVASLREGTGAADEYLAMVSKAVELARVDGLVTSAREAERAFRDEADAAITLLESKTGAIDLAVNSGWASPGGMLRSGARGWMPRQPGPNRDKAGEFAARLDEVRPGTDAEADVIRDVDAYVATIAGDAEALARFFAGLGAEHVDAIPMMLERCDFSPEAAQEIMARLGQALGVASYVEHPPEGFADILDLMTSGPGGDVDGWDRLAWLEFGAFELGWRERIISANAFDRETAAEWPVAGASWASKAELLGLAADRYELAFKQLAFMPPETVRTVLGHAGSPTDLVTAIYTHVSDGEISRPEAMLRSFAAGMRKAMTRSTFGLPWEPAERYAGALILGGVRTRGVPEVMRELTAEVADTKITRPAFVDQLITDMVGYGGVPDVILPLIARINGDENFSLRDAVKPGDQDHWRDEVIFADPGRLDIGTGFYRGGGYIEGPDGRDYPIVVPTVVTDDGIYTADTFANRDGPSVANLGGDDPGWHMVGYRSGVERIQSRPDWRDRLLGGAAATTGLVESLPSNAGLDYILMRPTRPPSLSGEPTTVSPIDPPPSDGTTDPTASDKIARHSAVLHTVLTGGQTAVFALNMDHQRERAYQVIFEQNEDGRRRARIETYSLAMYEDGAAYIRPYHLYVSDGSLMTQAMSYGRPFDDPGMTYVSAGHDTTLAHSGLEPVAYSVSDAEFP